MVSRKLFLVLLITGVAACGRSGGKQPDDVAKARKLVEVGQCKAAEGKLSAFIAEHPDSFDGYLALGDAFTCLAFEEKRADESRLREALKAYESALKVKKDSRAVRSIGAVSIFLGAIGEAGRHLKDAAEADGADLAATTLYALIDPEEGSAAFARAAAKRKPPAVEVDTKTLCPEGPCGMAVVLSETTVGSLRYEVGAILHDARREGDVVVFEDRVHPDAEEKQGWVLEQMPQYDRGYAPWKRSGPIESATVLERRMPDLPGRPAISPNCSLGLTHDRRFCTEAEAEELLRFKAEQDRWDNRGYRWTPERREQPFQAEMGVVHDVVPGSVKKSGAAVSVRVRDYPAYVFQPVTYQVRRYKERKLPLDKIAFHRVGDEAAAMIARTGHLTPGEKRALLAGHVYVGALLPDAALARGYDLRRASLQLIDGAVKLSFPWDGREEEVFQEGRCVKSPSKLDPFVDDDPQRAFEIDDIEAGE